MWPLLENICECISFKRTWEDGTHRTEFKCENCYKIVEIGQIMKFHTRTKHIRPAVLLVTGPDITGQLQVRPMLYTLYFDINLRVVKMLQTDNKQQITK